MVKNQGKFENTIMIFNINGEQSSVAEGHVFIIIKVSQISLLSTILIYYFAAQP